MGWSKFDDRRHTNGKLLAAGIDNPMRGLAANGLDANAITYCSANETDGFLNESALVVIAPGLPKKQRDDLTGRLVRVGRWSRDDDRGGWWVHDFLEYHPTHADLDKRREQDRERKAAQKRGAGGQFQAESAVESGWNPNGVRPDSKTIPTVPIPSHPDPSHPDPLCASTPYNCNPVAPPDEAGAEASNTGGENQLRELIARLRAVCTAANRRTVDRESISVIAQCLEHGDAELVAAAIDELEKWTDPPPTLPRLLFKAFAVECRKRGLPAPLLKLPDIGKRSA